MRKRLLLIALVLILTIPLTVLLRDFVREVVLTELLRVAWVVRMLFESVPQLLLWGMLVVVVLVIALRSLAMHRTPRPGDAEPQGEYHGQVRTLARWIRRANQGTYFRWTLARHLSDLTWSVMAYEQRTTPEQLKQRWSADGLDLPPVVDAYLRSAQVPEAISSRGILSSLHQRLRRRVPAASSDLALEQVVQFLEHQLEVQHDRQSG